jgi:2,3,4,5-tetrahydropyridine-2-carboxylate N-succinyltransferase
MTDDDLRLQIEALWARRENISPDSSPADREPVDRALDALDSGRLRVAEPGPDGWHIHAWLKQAVLLSFRLQASAPMPGAGGAAVFDKVAMKTAGWDEARFATAGFRSVPGAVVRRSAYIGPGVVLRPCFVKVGARVGEGTMIDTWSTVGSCAQVGARCHISGGVGLGGVLEPLQAGPVIVEDDCFIGARSEIAEGVIVERGAVISMGVFIGASTKIIDRATGEIFAARVPAYSVVVPGTLPGRALPDGSPGPGLACAVIVKRVDAQTRSKTAINDLLRDQPPKAGDG